MDYTTGQILTAGNEHQQRNPASLTKLMTGYVVDRAIDSHRISFDDMVTVGRDAWAKGNPVFDGSSLMFLKAGDRVSVRDLSRGLIVDSGNDACVALADYVAGGQPQFVAMMNEYVKNCICRIPTLKPCMAWMRRANTARRTILRCCRGLSFTASLTFITCTAKSLTWNGITQQNRNGLLWDKTMNVDGLKTGHTSGAGFNLIASAVDGQRRLIAVVMGADSPKGREQQAAKLLHWGQQNFDTVQVLQKGKRSAANVSGTVIKNKSSWAPIRISGWRCRSRKCRVLKPVRAGQKISRRPLPQINGSGKSHSMMATKWSRTGRW